MCEEASLTKPSAAPPVAAIYKTWTLSPISAFNARMVLICPVLERVTFEKGQPICAVLLYIHSRYKETQCQLYVLPKAPCGTATCSFPLLMLALLYNMHSCMPWRIRYTQRSGLALLSSSCPALQQTCSLLAAHAYCASLCSFRQVIWLECDSKVPFWHSYNQSVFNSFRQVIWLECESKVSYLGPGTQKTILSPVSNALH